MGSPPINLKKMKLARFINFTDDIFAHPSLGGHDDLCQWNREPYCFHPHSEITMEEWKCKFFAKHLTNRELMKMPNAKGEYHTSPKIDLDGRVDDDIFLNIFNQCYKPVEMEDQTPEKLKDTLINKPFCTQCDSKGVRHKKGCPTLLDKKTAESEFEGK